MTKITFLEDDSTFSAHICFELKALGYQVTHFNSGQSCMNHLVLHECDLCLFDWNLPDMPGTEVMRRLRQVQQMMPIIFLTGHDDESDVTQVLLSGADDYIVKPPVISVLHARIQSLLRRANRSEQVLRKEILGHLVINYENKIIFRNGQPVALTGSESILAFHFFLQRGQIVTRQSLYELLGIEDMAIDTRRLDVHISRLRSKLSLNAMNGWKLSSIYQQGYRLEYLYET